MPGYGRGRGSGLVYVLTYPVVGSNFIMDHEKHSVASHTSLEIVLLFLQW